MIDDNLIAVLALQGLAPNRVVAAERARFDGVAKRTVHLEADGKGCPCSSFLALTTGASGVAGKELGAWRSGNHYVLPTSPCPCPAVI